MSTPLVLRKSFMNSLRTTCSDLLVITKFRLNLLVLFAVATGMISAGWDSSQPYFLLNVLLASLLVAGGTSVFNQIREREIDARMRRTKDRPLPSGRMQIHEALILGLALTLSGLLWLGLAASWLAAGISLSILLLYVFVYTPLKKISHINTVIGALAGALPPTIGWVAERGALSGAWWVLPAIIFVWQIPHFLAIAWLYREDYALGGFKMLPVQDSGGHKTARQVVWYGLLLIPVATAPFIFNMVGKSYFIGTLLCSLALLLCCLRFARYRDDKHARQLFWASIVYLPVVMFLWIADFIPPMQLPSSP